MHKIIPKNMKKGVDKFRKMRIIVFVRQNIAGLCNGSTADSDSVCEGSNPSPAASKRSETNGFQTSFLVSDPLFDPLTVLGLLIDSAPHIGFHAVCAVLFHFFRDMAIYIQCKRCRCVAKVRLYSLHIIAILKAEYCIGIPLRYNYDKPEKPRISRVFGYLARFFILFQTEKSSREVVIS